MNCTEIKSKLLDAITLIEDFERDGMTIDRDAAIDKIREAYQLLRFDYVAPMVTAVSAPLTPPQTPESCAEQEVEEPEQTEEQEADEPEVEVEFILPEEDEEYDEADEEEQSEPEVEEYPEPKVEELLEQPEPKVVEQIEEQPEQVEVAEPEPTPEPIVEAPVAEVEKEAELTPAPTVDGVVEQSLFGFEPQVVRPKSHSRRRLISLYGDEPTPTPKVEPTPVPVAEPAPVPKVEPQPVVESQPTSAPQNNVAPKPFAEPAKVLGESVESVTTIADTIVAQPSVGESTAVNSLREAITVVNKFMLIRDLFDGDSALYEKTIDELDKMDNLDDSIIYIAENFAWRPSSEGAKLIVDLLQRKYR